MASMATPSITMASMATPSITMASMATPSITMASMTTPSFIATTTSEPPSPDTWMGALLWAMQVVMRPCVALIGVLGNAASIIVLTRDGYRKCSNILLISLAVSDISFLIGINNFTIYLGLPVFRFSREVNVVLWVCHNFLQVTNNVGCFCSLTIPVLITVERLIAVFAPLKFHSIVRPARAVAAVLANTLLWTVMTLYINSYQGFVLSSNGLVGRVGYTPLFYRDRKSGVMDALQNLTNSLTGVVPIVLVTAGCVMIGVKVKLASLKRQRITASAKGKESASEGSVMSRTTVTLMSVCVVYVIMSGFAFLVRYVIEGYFADGTEQKYVLKEIKFFTLYTNCTTDFVIYAAVNRKLRGRYLQLFSCAPQDKRGSFKK